MLTVILSGLLTSQQQIPVERLYEQTAPSVVTLSVERAHGATASGTAFLALRKNVAVTAWHVVKGAKRVVAKFSDGSEVEVKGLISKDTELDVAVIELDSGTRKPLKLAETDPKVGAKAFVIGSPKGMDFSISDGIISQTPYLAQGKLYQFTCPVSAGNSGGPLLNGTGQVMGVVSWQLRDAQNLNFAIPVSILSQMNTGQAATTFGPSIDTDVSDSPVLTTVDDQTLGDLIKMSELAATPQDDGSGTLAYLIESDGMKLTLFQYGKDEEPGPTENLSLSAGFNDDRKIELSRINSFNREHRFARAYRDTDGTMYLENDLDISKGIGKGNIVSFLADYSTTLREFETGVLSKTLNTKNATSFGTFNQTTYGLFATLNDNQIDSILTPFGQTTKVDDGTGKTKFTFSHDGAIVNVYQFTDDDPKGPTTSLTCTIGIDLKGDPDLAVINDYNRTMRFTKAFSDGVAVYLVADLDLHGGVTLETVQSTVTRFVNSINNFKKHILSQGQ